MICIISGKKKSADVPFWCTLVQQSDLLIIMKFNPETPFRAQRGSTA